jgi:hypothetical protein
MNNEIETLRPFSEEMWEKLGDTQRKLEEVTVERDSLQKTLDDLQTKENKSLTLEVRHL